MLKLFKSRIGNAVFSVQIGDEVRQVEVAPGKSVLDALLRSGVEISHSCGGMGSCGTCRFVLWEGDLPERNSLEAEIAEDRSFDPDERLACQTESTCGIKIRIP